MWLELQSGMKLCFLGNRKSKDSVILTGTSYLGYLTPKKELEILKASPGGRITMLRWGMRVVRGVKLEPQDGQKMSEGNSLKLASSRPPGQRSKCPLLAIMLQTAMCSRSCLYILLHEIHKLAMFMIGWHLLERIQSGVKLSSHLIRARARPVRCMVPPLEEKCDRAWPARRQRPRRLFIALHP